MDPNEIPTETDTPYLDDVIGALLDNSTLVGVGTYEVTDTDGFLEDLHEG